MSLQPAPPAAVRPHQENGEPTPCGINIAAGALIIVTAVLIAAQLPPSSTGWRCAVVAVGLAVVGAGTLDLLALLALVPSTWLVVNGFLLDRLGQLSWHGSSDLWCLTALSVGALAGLVLGALGRWAARS